MYENILSRLYGQPVALEINAFATIESIIMMRANGIKLSEDEKQAWQAHQYGAKRGAMQSNQPNQVAIIGLYGPMMSYSSAMQAISGATSTREFAQNVRMAADNPNVREIILDIASPGGELASVDTAVAAVQYARSKKKVTAVTEEILASAAYWVASQASEIIASPNAMIGSISVVYTHTDRTEQNARDGVKRTILTTGDKKAVGSPDLPLDDKGAAEMMRVATDAHNAFVSDVASGRGKSVDYVQNNWADGRVELGTTALKLGLVDRLGTLEDVITQTLKGEIVPDQLNAQAPAETPVFEAPVTEAPISAEAETLKAENAELKSQLKTVTRAAIVKDVLASANLPKAADDVEAAFATRCTEAAMAAESDVAARASVESIIAERQALTKGKNNPGIEAGDHQTMLGQNTVKETTASAHTAWNSRLGL
jgi:capsid assembly protease